MGRPGTRGSSKMRNNRDEKDKNKQKDDDFDTVLVDKEGVLHVDKKAKVHEKVEIKSETPDTAEVDNEEGKGSPNESETDEEFMVFKMTTGYEIACSKAAIKDLKEEWGEFILESKSFGSKE